jgi:hypothetical protein
MKSSAVFGGTDKTVFGSTDKTTRSEIGNASHNYMFYSKCAEDVAHIIRTY